MVAFALFPPIQFLYFRQRQGYSDSQTYVVPEFTSHYILSTVGNVKQRNNILFMLSTETNESLFTESFNPFHKKTGTKTGFLCSLFAWSSPINLLVMSVQSWWPVIKHFIHAECL